MSQRISIEFNGEKIEITYSPENVDQDVNILNELKIIMPEILTFIGHKNHPLTSTPSYLSKAWGVSTDTIKKWCQNNLVPYAFKSNGGDSWQIPTWVELSMIQREKRGKGSKNYKSGGSK